MNQLFEKIESMNFTDEENHPLKNCQEYIDLKKEMEKINAQYQLGVMSKRLGKLIKNNELKEYVEQLLELKGKIIDQFTLAYMAETQLLPSQIKFIQETDEFGVVEFSFEKKSLIIT